MHRCVFTSHHPCVCYFTRIDYTITCVTVIIIQRLSSVCAPILLALARLRQYYDLSSL